MTERNCMSRARGGRRLGATRPRRSQAPLLAMLVAAALLAGCTAAAVRPHRPAPVVSEPVRPGVPAKRPNVVFVLTDDLSMNLLSRMPHVRAMQRAGTTMSHYYVVDSLCCPSRTSILTGQYPHNSGVFTNAGRDGGYRAFNDHGNESKVFPLALQRAGYRTALMGKYLNLYQPGDPVPPGYDEWDVAGNAYREFNYTLNENGKRGYYGDDPSSYLVDVLANKGGQFIDSAAKAGNPFMLEVATFAPHAPYTPAPRYANTPVGPYPRTSAFDTLPTNPPSWLAGRPTLTRRQQAGIDADFRQRVRADKAVDDLIGHLQDRLRADGVADNTYVVFSSDNGYHMGEYRLLPGKKTAYDTDIHVPLVVTGPGVPAGATVDRLASNIDLAPTFEQLGGAKAPSLDGISLAGLWHAQSPRAWQQAVLIEHHGPNTARGDPDGISFAQGNPPSYEAIRTATGLYVRYATGEQEYYNTTRDPSELDNLATRGVPSTLRAMLPAMATCHGTAQCQAAAQLG